MTPKTERKSSKMQKSSSLYELFYNRAITSPDQKAYIEYQNGWQEYSYQTIASRVSALVQKLSSFGLQKGDKVAVLLRNSTDWVVAEQASLALELIVVPLYVDDRAESVAYIIEHCEAKLLFVQPNRYDKLKPHLSSNLIVLFAEDLQATSNQSLPAPKANLSDLATIVYTSGTLGKPKGVMLSHANILANTHAIAKLYDFSSDDTFLSFLPLSHMLERTAGHYLPMLTGAKVAYARSVQLLADDLRFIKPTILISVPRVYEKVYRKLNDKFAKSSKFMQFLWHKMQILGFARFEKQKLNLADQVLLLILDQLIASKVRASLGGNMRLSVSGGAALNYEISKCFLSLGINIVQGYGLTESSPVVSVNLPTDNRPQSVGNLLDQVEAKLGNDNELLVKSQSVMMGYYKDEASTASVIDKQGFLHTGDQVSIRDGFLYITGRIKEILVLSNGEKIPPSELENAIKLDALFDEAIIFGEGQAFLGAILLLNPDEWAKISDNYASLDDEKLKSFLVRKVNSLTSSFASYAKIRKVVITTDQWSIENGLLTPTMKLKRNEILKKYEEKIEKIYK